MQVCWTEWVCPGSHIKLISKPELEACPLLVTGSFYLTIQILLYVLISMSVSYVTFLSTSCWPRSLPSFLMQISFPCHFFQGLLGRTSLSAEVVSPGYELRMAQPLLSLGVFWTKVTVRLAKSSMKSSRPNPVKSLVLDAGWRDSMPPFQVPLNSHCPGCLGWAWFLGNIKIKE